MSADNKVKNTAHEVKGRLKRTAGAATDDPVREAKGEAEERSANLKQAGQKMKDAVSKH